jgi:hypothetical protein
MIKPSGKRDKRIALLLAAAFAWLFIGSLILFHEEHVLGKHFRLTSQLFISPKSNDKQGFAVKPVKPLIKSHDNGGSACIPAINSYSACILNSFEIKPRETSSFHPDDRFPGYFPLRAPPAI